MSSSTGSSRSPSSGEAYERQLSEAFAQWQGELLGSLMYLVGNLEDAQDALQDAFVKCWRHRQQLDGVENLKAWIFRIALNTGRDLRTSAWRRRRRDLAAEGAAGQTQPGDGQERPMHSTTNTHNPAAGLEEAEVIQQLRQAIDALRPEEKEVFLLRQNGEMTYEEIAASLEIPIGTAKTRMRLALGKLRANFGK